MIKKEPYFRRTNEFAYFNDDGELIFGIEGVCGNKNAERIRVEKVTDKQARIDQLLVDGFVQTKAKVRFPLTLEDYYDEEIMEEIVEDLASEGNPEHLALITWDGCCECDDNEEMIEYFVENYDKYKDIEYFTFGDMSYEVCEISWIEHGSYTEFFKKYNHIKGFSVQGTSSLELEPLDLPKLEILEIEGSGLTGELLLNVGKSKLPNLKKLNMWFGDENYNFDVSNEDIQEFFKVSDFPNLVSLGMCNVDHETFSNLLKEIFASKYITQIRALDISKSVSMSKDVDFLIENLEKATSLKYIDMHYNYLTTESGEKLQAHCEKLGIGVDISDPQDIDDDDDYDDDDDDFWSSPMYSE